MKLFALILLVALTSGCGTIGAALMDPWLGQQDATEPVPVLAVISDKNESTTP